MHELAITQSILEIALRHAPEPDQRITGINLVIGQLSSMIDDCVQFYWDIISENTLAQGATLHFRRIPAELTCRSCGLSYPMKGEDFTCPGCGSAAVRVTSGEEFFVESIEVETGQPDTTGVTS
jgi:hydrogenase nickel incorporation protein HypA/HybF